MQLMEYTLYACTIEHHRKFINWGGGGGGEQNLYYNIWAVSNNYNFIQIFLLQPRSS